MNKIAAAFFALFLGGCVADDPKVTTTRARWVARVPLMDIYCVDGVEIVQFRGGGILVTKNQCKSEADNE